MVQVNESGNVRYTLEKVYLSAPQACAERTSETCSGAGCSRGECVGTGDCDLADSESECDEYQGCSWDPDVCRGNAAETCEFGDYARAVPGCEIQTTKTPTCTGTPDACPVQPGCAAEGCGLGAGCVGGENSCSYSDDEVPGCECGDDECVGTYDCGDITDEDVCDGAGLSEACSWSTGVCVGTPTACNELTVDQCQTTAGCVLQAE